MNKLLQGIGEFQNAVFPRYEKTFRDLGSRQEPLAMVITCADSRIDFGLLTQTDPGDLFICRNAGNIVPPYAEECSVAATVEYAIDVLHLRHIIVCGHSDCGAMKAALNPDSTLQLPAVRRWLRHVERARRVALQDTTADTHNRLLSLTEENVIAQLENLLTYPCVAAADAREEVNLYGWVYDIPSGRIRVFDQTQNAFVAFDGTLPALGRRRAWRRAERAA